MRFEIAYATDIGRRRSQNQDNLAVAPDIGLFVVADGMGGHQGGEIASALVAEIVPQFVKTTIEKAGGIHGAWSPQGVLSLAIQEANRAIYTRSQRDPGLRGMGTTATALLFKDDTLTIGNVGDSRCYYFRPHCIWQATRDHSLVQEKIRAGLITREQGKTDKMKNVITRSVGFEETVDVETYQMKIKPSDAFMLCSDGLSGLIEDGEIQSITQTHVYDKHDPNSAVRELIAAANRNGGDDNITSIIVYVTE